MPSAASVSEGIFSERRDFVVEGLNALPGIQCQVPEGAFYAYPNVTEACRRQRIAHAEELGIAEDVFDGREFHVHVPAGAIPKDGPSAGVTMTTALASLLTGRAVRHTVGMTGEVTLQGRVLPIGGLKQKVLAAHAAGLTDVILPERNRADLDDVPEEVREAMTFHPVMTIGEVLDLALERAEAPT